MTTMVSRVVSARVRAEIAPAMSAFMGTEEFRAALGSAFESQSFETAVAGFCSRPSRR